MKRDIFRLYYFKIGNEFRQQSDMKKAIDERKIQKWISYNNPRFLNFNYPNDYALEEKIVDTQIFLYPPKQPIEFGPFLSLRVNVSTGTDLVELAKSEYKEDLVSYKQIRINNRTWLKVDIRDSYFNQIVFERYITWYGKGGYLEVTYSKDYKEYEDDFYKIFLSLRGF